MEAISTIVRLILVTTHAYERVFPRKKRSTMPWIITIIPDSFFLSLHEHIFDVLPVRQTQHPFLSPLAVFQQKSMTNLNYYSFRVVLRKPFRVRVRHIIMTFPRQTNTPSTTIYTYIYQRTSFEYIPAVAVIPELKKVDVSDLRGKKVDFQPPGCNFNNRGALAW